MSKSALLGIKLIIGALKQTRHWLHNEGRLNIFSKKKIYSKCVLAKIAGPPTMKTVSGPTDHGVKSVERRIMRSVGFKVESFIGDSLNLGLGGNRNSNQHVGCRGKSATVGSKPALVISSRTT